MKIRWISKGARQARTCDLWSTKPVLSRGNFVHRNGVGSPKAYYSFERVSDDAAKKIAGQLPVPGEVIRA